MTFILDVIKGFFIGAGAILPGISSGALCICFGLYEKLIKAILSFFSNIKENIRFLLPIVLGIFAGIFTFSNLLKFLYTNYSTYAKFFFAILIIASVPRIIKETQVKKFKVQYILSFLITFSLGIYMVFLENISIDIDSEISFISLLLAGIAMSFGVVIPGVSSTIILLLLGKYNIYLTALSRFDIQILFPLGIGLLIGSLALLYLIKLLLEKYKAITYFGILGFIVGSLPVLM